MATHAMDSGEESANLDGPSIESENADARASADSQFAAQKEILTNEIAHLKDLAAGDTRASSMMDRGVDMAVGILVVGLLTAYLLPIAISEIVGVDTSTWGSAEAQLFNLLPIFFVLAILLFVVNKAT